MDLGGKKLHYLHLHDLYLKYPLTPPECKIINVAHTTQIIDLPLKLDGLQL